MLGHRVNSQTLPLTFNLCWVNKTENEDILEYASDNQHQIFLLTANGRIKSIDVFSGNRLWSTEVGEDVRDLTFQDKIIHLTTNEEIVAFSSESGLLLERNINTRNKISQVSGQVKRTQLEEIIFNPDISSYLLLDENRLVTGNSAGQVKMSDLFWKKEDWKIKTGGKISSLTKFGDRIIATSYDNFVYMLSAGRGNNIWKKRLPGRINEKPIVTKDFLIFTVVGNGKAYIIDATVGKQISQITLIDENYFIKPLLQIGNRFIFQTSEGLSAYSTSECQRSK